jgi:hypothetical protein
VRRERGCLGFLPTTTRELLGLRAGLNGAPRTRSEAAMELGISRQSAARLERSGLRALHLGCGGSSPGSGSGGSTGAASARLASLAQGAPALQPASYLPASSAPSLRPAVDLKRPRGSQGVDSATASSPPPSSGNGPVSAAATSSPLGEDGSGGPGLPIVMAASLAALAALMLVALRRRAVAQQRGSTMSAAVAAPVATPRRVPDPAPVPPTHESTGWVGPSADPSPTPAPSAPKPEAPGSDASRLARSATVVASSVVSFAVRELIRRRGRR